MRFVDLSPGDVFTFEPEGVEYICMGCGRYRPAVDLYQQVRYAMAAEPVYRVAD